LTFGLLGRLNADSLAAIDLIVEAGDFGGLSGGSEKQIVLLSSRLIVSSAVDGLLEFDLLLLVGVLDAFFPGDFAHLRHGTHLQLDQSPRVRLVRRGSANIEVAVCIDRCIESRWWPSTGGS
jgi:hypothetical protein